MAKRRRTTESYLNLITKQTSKDFRPMNDIEIRLPDNTDSFDAPKWPGKYLALYRSVNETKRYTVAAPLSYIADSGHVITVRPGFVTDGASVPRLFWAYASPFSGAHAPAAVLHDALYSSHYALDRDVCDQIFYEALLSLPVRRTKAWAMYRSVRAGGWIAWKNKQNGDLIRARQLLDVRKLV